MVARATSAQSFLRTLPHTLLRLVPPSAGRPRCAAPPSQLPVSTRSAFFQQVRHKKGMPFVSLHGCAGYFGATVSPHAPPHPLAPRAAFGGATALRCSTFPAPQPHAQRVLPAGPPQKNAADAAFFCGGPARARTAVLQSSSADTTRLVCDQISPAGSPQTTCSLGTLP